MKKILITFICILAIVFFIGCNDWQPRPVFYKSIEKSEFQLPNSCDGSQNDACSTFSCLTPNCWCKQSPDAIITEGSPDLVIETEDQAVQLVASKLLEKSLTNPAFIVGNVTTAAKVNSIFYNVFVEDPQGNETVYSVAVDGAIIETVCGV